MGNFLNFVSMQGEIKTICPLINMNLSKIREFHGTYKSICNTFAINYVEFETIFCQKEQTFAIWDTDGNGLIDALEFFSGIIIFSDSKAEDKIRFIFDLFDLNEIQTLSTMDLEFALQCIMMSTSKIFNVGADLDEREITAIVRAAFNEGIRINLPMVLRWCSVNDIVILFFQTFKMAGPEQIVVKSLTNAEIITYEQYKANAALGEDSSRQLQTKKKPSLSTYLHNRFYTRSSAQLVNNKRSQNYRLWLSTALTPLMSYRMESKTVSNYTKIPNELYVKLEWVYGIRSNDSHKGIQYTVGCLAADSVGARDEYTKKIATNNEELIYFVASVVILLNPTTVKQRFYVRHDQEVISAAVSTEDGSIIASGELGEKPAIHIWSRKSLECITVIKGLHKQGVHLMQFSTDNKYLVTCSLCVPSAVIVFDWQTSEVVVSTMINSPAHDIFLLQEINTLKGQSQEYSFLLEDEESSEKQSKRPQSGIVVISSKEMVVFTVMQDDFAQHSLDLNVRLQDGYTLGEPTCGMAIIADYKNQYFQNLESELAGQQHLFLTGHKDGKVLLWRFDSLIAVLIDYQDEITCMSKCFEGIAICTWAGKVHIWDSHLSRCTNTIELVNLPFKTLSFNIASADYNQKRLLVLTIAGDVIELGLSESGGPNAHRVKAKKITAISQISGPQSAMSCLNQIEQTVLIGGQDGCIMTYDIESHELIDVWPIGQQITAIATLSLEEGGFIVAAGTVSGNIMIKQDWEEIIPRLQQCGTQTINDLQFSKTGQLLAAASSDMFIYLFQLTDGDYVKLSALKIEKCGFPISLAFSDDSKKIVINTSQRKLLLLDPSTYQLLYRVEDIAQCFWSVWSGRYPLITKSTSAATGLIPICIGNQSNIVVAGDENGNVFLWPSQEQIRTNVGVNLTGHASALSRVLLTNDDSRLLTLGQQDQSIFQWTVTKVEQTMQVENLSKVSKFETKEDKQIHISDSSLISELNFCAPPRPHNLKEDGTPADVKPAHVDDGLLIRGCKNVTVNKLLSRLNYDATGEQEWKRPPVTTMSLEHIYGVQTSDRRDSVMYMHFHSDSQTGVSEKSQNKSAVMSVQKSISRGLTLTQMQNNSISQNPAIDAAISRAMGQSQIAPVQHTIRYDQEHAVCHKHFVYYISRFAILYSPFQKQQKFYQGHTHKISCIQKHPTRPIIATGEVCEEPTIHVWDAQTQETISVLELSHKGGVLCMAFSPDGLKLASVGMDAAFSLQVYQWEHNKVIAFRNLGEKPVFGIRFYPFENSRFITCGYEHMSVWRLHGNHLACKNFLKFESQKPNLKKPDQPLHSVLMTMEFLNYKVGNSVHSDVIFGTSEGEITTYQSGKHFLLNENAHNGAINCMRVSDRLLNDSEAALKKGAQLCVITGSEDGTVKIWTIRFKLLQIVRIESQVPEILKDFKNKKCFGVQSIEFYGCDKQYPRRLIIGIRCGEIVEAIVNDFKQNDADKPDMTNDPNQLLNLQIYSQVSAHSSLQTSQNQKKIQCVVNPDHPVLISAGDDETLRIWDLEKHSLLYSKHMGSMITAIAYSPDGAYLAVGFISGVIFVLDAKLDRIKYEDGTASKEFMIPNLKPLMTHKESQTAIVCIKYSFQGDFLAVSFSNERRSESQAQSNVADIGTYEPAFIIVYVNRISSKNPHLKMGSIETYVKLIKIVLPLETFQSNANIRQQLVVTSMDFSQCDNFLQMCVQRMNNEIVIETKDYKPDDDIFIVWNIVSNTMVQNLESMNETNWLEWSMAPAIHARFQGTDINCEDDQKERELLFAESNHMLKVNRFSFMDTALCGSHYGSLHLFRFASLIIDKSTVADFRFDLVRKSEMAATRSLACHASQIQCIENFQDKFVMTTAVSDQCITQWNVEFEDNHWEMDFNAHAVGEPDPFGEFLSQEKFEKLQSEVWNSRKLVAEINQAVYKKEYQDPVCRLELKTVIGRRAFDRRMNVQLDHNDRITYLAGSLGVFLTQNTEYAPKTIKMHAPSSQFRQEFLRPDGEKFKSHSPELSCFCLSKDLRLMFIGTCESLAHVYIWEITTNQKLGEFAVPNVPVISNVKTSADAAKVLVLGMTKDFFQVITMVDWTHGNKVLFTRQFLHSYPYKIRDLEFMPGSMRNFVTVGIQHLCFWKLSGTTLQYHVGELTAKKVMTNIGYGVSSHMPNKENKFGLCLVMSEVQQLQLQQKHGRGQDNIDEEYENLFVTFLNIAFIGETLVTSGDNGYLYLWSNERLDHRTYAHEGSIYALHVNNDQQLLVSGGLEGCVTIWRMNIDPKKNTKSLQRIKVYNLRSKTVDPQTAVMNPETNVQSVCLGQTRIIVGMRSGSIYEVNLQEDNMKGLKQDLTQITPTRQWLKCTDHEIPKSVAMDLISSRIFTLTNFGLFQVWDLVSFDVIFSKNFAKKAKYLLSFRLSNKVLIVFENDIVVMDSDPKTNHFDEKADYFLALSNITYACLNCNEQILGVATQSASQQPQISLYSTDNGFMKLKQIFGFKSQIKYIDFSTDNNYMAVEDTLGEVTLYEIETDRPIQTDAIDFELEWLGDGLRTYARLKGVRHQYDQSNKIMVIKKLLGKPIILIADEIGTVRLFNYPNVQGESYYQCYAEHLFRLSDCSFSPDRLHLVSCSEMDRCVFQWQLNINELKVQRLLTEDQRRISQQKKVNSINNLI